MPKADALIPSVSAASILAKVARDRYMAEQDKIYPGYGFRQNAGYGVAAHREAIERLGVTPLHRLSFAPLRKYRSVKDENGSSAGKALKAYRKTTRQIGDDSETVATEYLIRAGHEIIKRNWRTKWCEIDIVSRKDGVIYFTEVKHRKNDQAGGGIEAITPGKLRQMRFSASLYASSLKEPYDLRLSAIATTGTPPVVSKYLDTI